MALSNDLISEFVKATMDEKEPVKESTAYGKIVIKDGKEYVQLDGSELLTPISTTTVVKDEDRVMVTIKNHTAIVTGDLTNPSASNKDVTEIGNKISEFEIIIADKVTTEQLEAEVAKINKLVTEEFAATNAEIETLTGKVAKIDKIETDIIDVSGKITATEAEIDTLRADIADFKDVTADRVTAVEGKFNTLESDYAEFEETVTTRLEAAEADIKDLDTEKLDAETAKITYATIDFANINEAAIEKLFTDSGIIKDLIMSDGKVTGELVGVTIKGDIIEGNTVKADKLVILGEDGLYYKLNVDALGETTASSDEKYQNGLDGSAIIAESITAEKIAVDDLVAFGATIGGFKINNHAIYSGVKNSINNTTTGIYLGDDGQVNIGDQNNFLKYYIDENGKYRLEIQADSLRFGSSNTTIEEYIQNNVEIAAPEAIKTVEGTELNIYDGKQIIDFYIYGKSTQDTRAETKVVRSKNIIPTNFSDWESGNWDMTTGNKADYPTRLRTKRLVSVSPNRAYYMETAAYYNMVIREYDSSKKLLKSNDVNYSIGGAVFTTSATTSYISVTLYEGADYATFQSKWSEIKPFICLNEEPNKSYSEYKEQYSIGKNLFNYMEGLLASNCGITNVLHTDHSITTSGVPTINWNAVCTVREITDILDDGGRYTISQKNVSEYVYLQITMLPIDSSESTVYISSWNGSASFTVDKSKYTYHAKIQCASMETWGTSSRTINNTYQLEKGSTATEFERYGVSPSPDYPSEIVSLGYENLFDFANQNNYFSANQPIKLTKIDNGIRAYNNAGTNYVWGTYLIKDIQKLLGKTLTLSYVAKANSTNEPAVRVYWWDLATNTYKDNIAVFKNKNSGSFTLPITPPGDNYCLAFFFYSNYETAATGECYVDYTNIQLEEGLIRHSCIPFGKYGYEIIHRGKNLFDYVTNLRPPMNGLTNTINPDGSITVKGIPTGDYTSIVPTGNIDKLLEDGKQYTISQSIDTYSKVYLEVRAKNKSTGNYVYYTIQHGVNHVTFTVDKSTYSYDIYIVTGKVSNWGTSSQTITCKYQLEKGSVATEFEPYRETEIIFTLDEPLRGFLDGVKDIAKIQNGVLSVERKVGYKQITATMVSSFINDLGISKEARVNKSAIGNVSSKDVFGLMSNTFRKAHTWNVDKIGICNNAGTVNEQIAFRIPIDADGTYFDTNPTYVIYELETPYTEEIGPVYVPMTEGKLNTYYVTDSMIPDLYSRYGTIYAGLDGQSIYSVTDEYYVSTSKTTLTGGSWSEVTPTWSVGKYLWIRSKIVYSNPTATEYTEPMCDSSWDAINEVKVGGRNYLLNTANSKSHTGKGGTNECMTLYKFSNYGLNDFVSNPGTPYVVSFDWETTAESGTFSTQLNDHPWTVMSNVVKVTPDNKSGHIEYKFVSESNIVNFPGNGIHIREDNLTGITTISNMKFEKGNKSTDWTPAPEDLDTAIDNIEIGGRNYIRSSRDFARDAARVTGWVNSGGYTFSTEDDFTVASLSKSGLTESGYYSLFSNSIDIDIVKDKTVCISFDIKVDDVNAWDVKIPFIWEYDNIDRNRVGWKDMRLSDNTFNIHELKSGVWTRLVCIIPPDMEMGYSAGHSFDEVAFAGIRLCLFKNGSVHYRKVKLELGNKATDWSPAPEDGDKALSDTAGEIYEKITKVSAEILVDAGEIVQTATKELVTKKDFEHYTEVTAKTEMKTTSEGVFIELNETHNNGRFNDLDGDIKSINEKLDKNFSFTQEGMIIGSGDSAVRLIVDNENGIIFERKDGYQLGYWDGNDFYAGNIVIRVDQRAQFGNYAYIPKSDGSLMFTRVK